MVVKKKMETSTFKLNIREIKILLSAGGGATCRHYAYFIHVLLFFIKNFFVNLLMVTRSKLVHSEIN